MTWGAAWRTKDWPVGCFKNIPCKGDRNGKELRCEWTWLVLGREGDICGKVKGDEIGEAGSGHIIEGLMAGVFEFYSKCNRC